MITVVIPTRDSARLIGPCLSSLVAAAVDVAAGSRARWAVEVVDASFGVGRCGRQFQLRGDLEAGIQLDALGLDLAGDHCLVGGVVLDGVQSHRLRLLCQEMASHRA